MLSLLMFIQLAAATPQPLTVGVGEPALVFALPALNQAQAVESVKKASVSLSDFVGVMPAHARQAVVVHFFSRKRGAGILKDLHRIQKRNESKGVQVLGVCACSGESQALVEWAESENLNFPVVHDGHRVVSQRYGVTEFPITMIVDAHGRVFAIGQPKGETAEEEVQAEVDGVLSRR
jgi:peroxiredoxin